MFWHKHDDFLKYGSISIGYALILSFVTLTLFFLLIASSCTYWRSMAYEDEYFGKYFKADSLRNELLQKEIDSYAKEDSSTANDRNIILLERIAKIEKQQEIVLSDIRQESNNIINKFNGWLGFWIAILAIFGGIVPLVLQYITKRKSEKDIQELMNRLERKAESHQLELLISCVSIGYEQSIIADSPDGECIKRILILEAIHSLEQIIEIVDNKEIYLDRESEIYVINALVQYCRLLDILKLNSKTERIRNLTNLSDRIKNLIKDIMNHEKCSRRDIWNRLIDLLPNLKSVSLSIDE